MSGSSSSSSKGGAAGGPVEPAKAKRTPKYRRILLKLSGEMLGGRAGVGFDYEVIKTIGREISAIAAAGVKLGLVVGGGNIFRGTRSAPPEMDRVAGDNMGMLGTVINAICLQSTLENLGMETRVMTAIEMSALAEPYIRRRAGRHLDKGRVVIFAGGTGHPFFSTDTAAALRASEMGAELLIKGTKVDGVYDKDPVRFSDAVRFDKLDYQEVMSRELQVMDSTAVAFCKDNKIPILVLNIETPGILMEAICGKPVGTLVS
ncbi:MAG: UMP kinase [bacterium]